MIFHLITNFESWGGAERNLLKIINNSNNSVVIISLKSDSMKKYINRPSGADSAAVIALELNGILEFLYSPFIVARVIREHTEEEKTKIISWMYHACFVAALVKIISRGKYVCWNIRHSLDHLASDSYSTRLAIAACSFVAFLANRIIYNSFKSRDQHKKIFFLTSATSSVVYNPIEDEFLLRSNKIRRSLGCRNKNFLILGRNHPNKNFNALVCAIIDFIDEGNDECHFFFYGDGVDVLSRHLEPRHESLVFFSGPIMITADFFDQFDFLISSSLTESFPNVVLEAMARGLPCIVTNRGDAPLIVGKSAVAVCEPSQKDLKAAIVMASKIDENTYSRLSFEARSIVSRDYIMSSFKNSYSNLFFD